MQSRSQRAMGLSNAGFRLLRLPALGLALQCALFAQAPAVTSVYNYAASYAGNFSAPFEGPSPGGMPALSPGSLALSSWRASRHPG